MPIEEHVNQTLEVEMVIVEIEGADDRVRLAYKLLLKASARKATSTGGKTTTQSSERNE
jgi:hypothetical protein